MESLLPFLDLVFYDLKIMDGDTHAGFTGSDNTLILDNFTGLSKNLKNLQARMPVIPGVNDSRANIAATAEFLKMNDRDSIHCLPYHNMGEAKIPRLTTCQKSLNLESSTAEDLTRVKALFETQGVEAIIYE